MRIGLRRAAGGFAMVAMLGGSLFGNSSIADAASGQKLKGKIAETAAGADLGYRIRGNAQMSISDASTVVVVEVEGLTSGQSYSSHLHNGSCASGGGGHYQHIEGGLTTPPNELWLSSGKKKTGITPRGNQSVVSADGSADWEARIDSQTMTNARSVVIHAPGGTRIACADLELQGGPKSTNLLFF